MTAKPIRFACVLVLALAAASVARGQETGKTKDAELDSLLENLKDREEGHRRLVEKSGQAGSADRRRNLGPAESGYGQEIGEGGRARSKARPSRRSGRRPDQARTQIAEGREALRPRIKRSMICWENWVRARTSRRSDDRPRNQGPGAGQPPPERKPGEKEGAKLGGKDKEIDDRLEELAGRKRKRPRADDEERSGPVGEMIKEMRDVEQRLGKPDPSEDTQAKQKQIIKRIDTLIEQVRQSGSSAGRLTMQAAAAAGESAGPAGGRSDRAPWPRGAGPMKPAKPTSQHSTAGGKGIWGHLPEELRQVMDNSFKEDGAGLEGGDDQPVLPVRRKRKAGPGGVTRWLSDARLASSAGRSVGYGDSCSACALSLPGLRHGRGAAAGSRAGEVGRGIRRVASRRRSRRDRPDDDAEGPTRRSRTALPGWAGARMPTDRSAAGRIVATSR